MVAASVLVLGFWRFGGVEVFSTTRARPSRSQGVLGLWFVGQGAVARAELEWCLAVRNNDMSFGSFPTLIPFLASPASSSTHIPTNTSSTPLFPFPFLFPSPQLGMAVTGMLHIAPAHGSCGFLVPVHHHPCGMAQRLLPLHWGCRRLLGCRLPEGPAQAQAGGRACWPNRVVAFASGFLPLARFRFANWCARWIQRPRPFQPCHPMQSHAVPCSQAGPHQAHTQPPFGAP